jgi:hypothetical protein
VALLLAATDPPAGNAVLSQAEYAERLSGLALRLREGNLGAARAEASALETATVATGAGVLATDLSLLRPLRSAGAPPRGLIARLERTAEALAPAPDPGFIPPDQARLETLTRSEAIGLPPEGGEVALPGARGAWERHRQGLARAAEWLAERLEWLGEWLQRWWPGGAGQSRQDGGPGIRVLVAVAVAVIVLLLGLLAWSRKKGRDPVELQPGVVASPSRRDEDPLSREADEWERFARKLEASGRGREAIRAWFHAGLVTLFRAGLVQHRTGRTNWEYVSALGPERAFRGRFIELVRGYERVWYGTDSASGEVLVEYRRAAQRFLGVVRTEQGSTT